jgi:hypothetical protein
MGLALLASAGLLSLSSARQQEPSYEAVVKDMLSTVEDITKTLGTITDQETAQVASPKLEAQGKKLQALRLQADKLPQPEKEEKDRLELTYRVKFDDALKRLRAESVRVKAIPGGDAAVKLIRPRDKEQKKEP